MPKREHHWPVEIVDRVAAALYDVATTRFIKQPQPSWVEARIDLATQQYQVTLADAALAAVEEYMQEREAGIWSAGFHVGRKADPRRASWPANPYRMEAP